MISITSIMKILFGNLVKLLLLFKFATSAKENIYFLLEFGKSLSVTKSLFREIFVINFLVNHLSVSTSQSGRGGGLYLRKGESEEPFICTIYFKSSFFLSIKNRCKYATIFKILFLLSFTNCIQYLFIDIKIRGAFRQ